jgi:hypothetical protein
MSKTFIRRKYEKKATRDGVVLGMVLLSLAVLLTSWAIHQWRGKVMKYEGLFPFKCPSERVAFEELRKQMTLGGAQVAFVNISDKKGYRGLYTTKPITKGESILSVPMELTLSVASFSGRLISPAMTSAWSSLDEDADQMLDVLALMTELLVNGASSPWHLYFCTLPPNLRSFNLPITMDSKLLRLQPELSRLVGKRLKALDLFLPLFVEALKAMPGMTVGKDQPDWLRDQGKFKQVFLWAYAASKTRTVSLDLEKADEVGATLLMQRALLTKTSKSLTPVGLSSGPTGNAFEVPIIPTGAHDMRSWVGEIGCLVPIFDMVNHQGLDKASSSLAVSFKKRKGGGVGVHFSLVAARDLEADSEVTFSYNPDDDAEPVCDLRWYAEYGFLPSIQDPRQERQCHIFNLTSEAIESASLSLGSSRAKDVPVPSSVAKIKLDGTGVVRPMYLPTPLTSVLEFISENSGSPPPRMNEKTWSLQVLIKCLEQEEAILREAYEQIESTTDFSHLLEGSMNAIQDSINLIKVHIESSDSV